MCNKKILIFLFLILAIAYSGFCDRIIPPVVSTDWLEENMYMQDLVIIDLRDPAEYGAGHVPGSISAFFPLWWIIKDGLLLELPETEVLFAFFESLGLTSYSNVVLVDKIDTDFDRADPGRVAWTLIYGGVENVAILNGGINKWVADGKAMDTEATIPNPSFFDGIINEDLVVDKEYVERKLRFRKSIIVDARIPEDYFGISYMFASKPGHISGATNFPIPWVFNEDGTLKLSELPAMAEGILGKYPDFPGRNRHYKCKQKKIILYCGVGGYAAVLWFLLTEVLDYENVTVYDGAIQEWTLDPEAPVTVYKWE